MRVLIRQGEAGAGSSGGRQLIKAMVSSSICLSSLHIQGSALSCSPLQGQWYYLWSTTALFPTSNPTNIKHRDVSNRTLSFICLDKVQVWQQIHLKRWNFTHILRKTFQLFSDLSQWNEDNVFKQWINSLSMKLKLLITLHYFYLILRWF